FLRRIHQLADRRRLVARGLVVGDELEPAAAHRFLGALRLVRNERFGGIGFLQASANNEFGHVYEYGTPPRVPQSLARGRGADSVPATRLRPSRRRGISNAPGSHAA